MNWQPAEIVVKKMKKKLLLILDSNSECSVFRCLFLVGGWVGGGGCKKWKFLTAIKEAYVEFGDCFLSYFNQSLVIVLLLGGYKLCLNLVGSVEILPCRCFVTQ